MNPMLRTASSMGILLLVVSGFAVVLSYLDSMWSPWSDLAHHYALVVRHYEHWHLAPTLDASLGEMNFYPRASHQMAAIVGRVLGSPLIGLQTVALASLVLAWASICTILLGLQRTVSLTAAVAMGAFLVFNRSMGLDLHGNEIIENYFFAQLVGHAFALLSIAAMRYGETQGLASWKRNFFLIAAAYCTASIHLLPALELLCFLLLLVALDCYNEVSRKERTTIRSIGVAFTYAGIAVIALKLHPSFAAMQTLSSNDGNIFPKFLPSALHFAGYATVVSITSIAMAWAWLGGRFQLENRDRIAIKYISLYGLGVSGLCLLQVVSLYFGSGSEYAVKKHVFALNSAFLVELSVLIGMAFHLQFPSIVQRLSATIGDTFAQFVPALLMALAIWSVVPATKHVDTSDLVNLESQLMLRRDTAIPSVPGKFDYLLGFQGIQGSIAYMLSIGVLKTPRSENSLDVLFGRALSDWSIVGTVITSENSYLDQNRACRRSPPSNGIAILDGACVGQSMELAPVRIGFTAQDGAFCKTKGFGMPELTGTWIQEIEATINCRMPMINGKAPDQLLIDADAFVPGDYVQHVLLSVNGLPPIRFQYGQLSTDKVIKVSLPANIGPALTLQLVLPDAISPRKLGVSDDTRKLSIHIKSLEFR
jgi:hypothetical protein